MIVEWECILDCNYNCKYCTNGRNKVLDKPIKHIEDPTKIYNFLSMLKNNYPDSELFLFGGEPFLHPKIVFIINTLNELNMKFVIQTNFSYYNKIEQLKNLDWVCQVSVHRTQIKDIDLLITNLKKYKNKIRKIDIMYTSLEDIKLHSLLKKHDIESVIAPVADFKTSKRDFLPSLIEFNKFKKIFDCFELGDRSYKWEAMFTKNINLKGKPCIYKDKYILFDPSFKSYNCSHRINCDICPNDACFLM
jgi:radical SAM superfamily